ncbi:hypothetical protein ACFP8W_07170 [Nocardioides hankookensis]
MSVASSQEVLDVLGTPPGSWPRADRLPPRDRQWRRATVPTAARVS